MKTKCRSRRTNSPPTRKRTRPVKIQINSFPSDQTSFFSPQSSDRSSQISIASINIGSSIQQKLTRLKEEAMNSDILVLCEIHDSVKTLKRMNDRNLLLPFKFIFSEYNKKNKNFPIAALIHPSIIPLVEENTETHPSLPMLRINLNINKNKKFIAGIYSPSSSSTKFRTYWEEFFEWMNPNNPKFLLGDFNSNLIETRNPNEEWLAESLIERFNLIPCLPENENPSTFCRIINKNNQIKEINSFIDHILTSETPPELQILPLDLSLSPDHCKIIINKQKRTNENNKIILSTNYKKTEKNLNKLKNELSDLQEINIIEKMENCIEKNLKLKNNSIPSKCWELLKTFKKLRKALKSLNPESINKPINKKISNIWHLVSPLQSLPTSLDEDETNKLKIEILKSIRFFQKKWKKQWKIETRKQIDKNIQTIKKSHLLDPKKLTRYVKCSYRADPPIIIQTENKIIENEEEIKEKIQNEYEKIFFTTPKRINFKKNFVTPLNENLKTKIKSILEPLFSLEEVTEALDSSKGKSAPGSSGLTYEMIQSLRPEIDPKLCNSFNEYKKSLKFPESWNTSIIKLIPKKKNSHKMIDKRPISLTESSYKIYMKLKCQRYRKFLNDIISPVQMGFVPGRSTHQNIILIQEIINDAKSKNKELHILYIDINKAYDSVQHNSLYKILKKMEFPEKEIEELKTLYQNAKIQIKLNSSYSEPFKLQSGIKQGCPLSCILFILYINPLIETIRKKFKGYNLNGIFLSILAFVDDLILIADSKFEMEKMFKELKSLLKKLQFKLGINDKNKSVYTTNSLNRAELKIKIEKVNHDIPFLPENEFYRVLGTSHSLDNSCENQQKSLNQKIAWTITNLYSSICSPIQIIKIYNEIIVPTITYRSCTMDFPEKFFSKIENKFSSLFYNKLRGNKWNSSKHIKKDLENFGMKMRDLKFASISARTSLKIRLVSSNDPRIQAISKWIYSETKIKDNITQIKNTPIPSEHDIGPWSNPNIASRYINLIHGKDTLSPIEGLYGNYIFTDGSFRTKASAIITQSAIWDRKGGLFFPTILSPGSFGAELEAILFALSYSKGDITIISDSKSAIDQIEKIRNLTLNQILKANNGLILSKIYSILNSSRNIKFKHIHSHQIDSNGIRDKNKLEKTEKIYLEDSNLALEGNQKADSLASQDPPFPRNENTFFIPILSLETNKYMTPFSSQKEINKSLIGHTKLYLPNCNVDSYRNIMKFSIQEGLENFLFRLIHKKLFSPKNIADDYNPSNPLSTPPMIDPLCYSCNQFREYDHFINCLQYRFEWQNLFEKIKEITDPLKISLPPPWHSPSQSQSTPLFYPNPNIPIEPWIAGASGILPLFVTSQIKEIRKNFPIEKNLEKKISILTLKESRKIYFLYLKDIHSN
jgi:ribonuclease HI